MEKKKNDAIYGEMPSSKIIELQKEIDGLMKLRSETLERLYDLKLSPFRGYYERLLKDHEKNVRTL